MRLVGIIVGLIVALAGAVWALQGLNSELVPQSFMTGSRAWVVIGGLAVVVGLGLAAWSRQRD